MCLYVGLPAEGPDHGGEVGCGGERLAVTATVRADASVQAAGNPSIINGHTLSIFRVTCYYPVMSDLTKDLYAYLMSHMYSVSHDLRTQGYWVMSDAWRQEIRQLTDVNGYPIWTPSESLSDPEVLFGRPVHVDHRAGIPRLQPVPVHAGEDWVPLKRYM